MLLDAHYKYLKNDMQHYIHLIKIRATRASRIWKLSHHEQNLHMVTHISTKFSLFSAFLKKRGALLCTMIGWLAGWLTAVWDLENYKSDFHAVFGVGSVLSSYSGDARLYCWHWWLMRSKLEFKIAYGERCLLFYPLDGATSLFKIIASGCDEPLV